MMRCRLVVVILLTCVCVSLQAQPKHARTQMIWLNYNNSIVLNNKWTWSNDFQLRTREWLQHWWQTAIRTGMQYKLNKKWTMSAGVAWFDNVRYYEDEPVFANEWRPWVDIGFQQQAKKITIVQRLRFEERFLQKVLKNEKLKDYERRDRLRYRLEFTLPPISKKVEMHIGNEVMVNLNHINDSLFFDQNRILFITNFKISPASFFQFQYIKNFQLLARNYTLENQDIFRFSFHQQFYRRKNK